MSLKQKGSYWVGAELERNSSEDELAIRSGTRACWLRLTEQLSLEVADAEHGFSFGGRGAEAGAAQAQSGPQTGSPPGWRSKASPPRRRLPLRLRGVPARNVSTVHRGATG